VDAKELGLESLDAAAFAPEPDLNGVCIKGPASPKVYLMDQGLRRWIPNPQTYSNLFRDGNTIYVHPAIGGITEGIPISNGAILAKANNAPSFYLVDQGMKRHITSPAVMDLYNFDGNKVCSVPGILLDSLPTGPAI
jgi:hypothetical protein